MTENKRFFLLEYKNNVIYDSEKDKEYSVQFKKQKQSLCVLLNEQEERIQELETVMRQIVYETRANYAKEEYSATVSISPQMHDKLTELITEVK